MTIDDKLRIDDELGELRIDEEWIIDDKLRIHDELGITMYWGFTMKCAFTMNQELNKLGIYDEVGIHIIILPC